MNFDDIKRNFNFDADISEIDEYFQSVVLLLLIKIDNDYHIVFEKRCADIRQGNEICFPGGRIDKYDDSLQETALRETEEELGIPKNKINIFGRLNTVIAPMGAIIHGFVGFADIDKNEININPKEVERFFTIPISYFLNNEPEQYFTMVKVHPTTIDNKTNKETVLLPAKELGLPETYYKPWGSHKNKVYVYKTEFGVIWGITAKFIVEFIKTCKKSMI